MPLIGTLLGAAAVFFIKDSMNIKLRSALAGFASGIMIAASVWSLIIPAIEMSTGIKWLPAVTGFLLGVGFLLIIDIVKVPQLCTVNSNDTVKDSFMLIFAVTLHNIPEGMAVGVILAGMLDGNSGVSPSSALALSFGIAVQNIPEGTIISAPLAAGGMKRGKSFWYGVLSGVVEPIAAVITLLLTSLIIPVLPYILCFAAGAMVYVVVEELVPEYHMADNSYIGTVGVALGFSIMMILDVALG